MVKPTDSFWQASQPQSESNVRLSGATLENLPPTHGPLEWTGE